VPSQREGLLHLDSIKMTGVDAMPEERWTCPGRQSGQPHISEHLPETRIEGMAELYPTFSRHSDVPFDQKRPYFGLSNITLVLKVRLDK